MLVVACYGLPEQAYGTYSHGILVRLLCRFVRNTKSLDNSRQRLSANNTAHNHKLNRVRNRPGRSHTRGSGRQFASRGTFVTLSVIPDALSSLVGKGSLATPCAFKCGCKRCVQPAEGQGGCYSRYPDPILLPN